MPFTRHVDPFLLSLVMDAGVLDVVQIDSAFVFNTSGKAVALRFQPKHSLSAGALVCDFYCTAIFGSPSFKCELRDAATGIAAGLEDRPIVGGSALATSAAVIPVANRWAEFTLTASLTAHVSYWLIVRNDHGTPASNWATFAHRGALDGHSNSPNSGNQLRACGTLDGFVTIGNFKSSAGLAVVKIGSNDPIGFPYVTSASSSTNTNHRGVRVKFLEDIIVSAMAFQAWTSAAANNSWSSCRIYKSDGTLVVNQAIDRVGTCRGVQNFDPVTLTGGVEYDCVVVPGTSTSTGAAAYMGETSVNLPANVLASRPAGIIGMVNGATPGSYTLDTTRLLALQLLFDSNPAIGGLLVHPGMSGGARG